MDLPEREPMQSVRIRDVSWLALASILGLLFVANALGTVVAAARHHWGELLGAPVGFLFLYWTTVGAWRRTIWSRRRRATPATRAPDDPGWHFDPAALVVFVPGGIQWYLRRADADRLIALRSMSVAMSVALVLFATTLAGLQGVHSGPVVPWIPVLCAFALSSVLGDQPISRRKLDCSSDELLAKAYMSLVALRIVTDIAVALTAFALSLIGGPVWSYYAGAGFALVRLWTGIAPTRRALARDERRALARGCERSLVEALRPARAAPGESA